MGMTQAISKADPTALAAWRPLIYHCCHALEALPRQQGLLYKAVSLPVDIQLLRPGSVLSLHSFSSLALQCEATRDTELGGGLLFEV